jgi:uncharacterized protein (UPF0333 family)
VGGDVLKRVENVSVKMPKMDVNANGSLELGYCAMARSFEVNGYTILDNFVMKNVDNHS